MTQIEPPAIASQAAWLTTRDALLLHEKELTRQRARVHAEQRRLPRDL